jgi:type-F conjugative transfer system secretin TraK
MKLINKTLLITLGLVGLTNSTFAKEIFEANNGDTISATISATDLTRIEIEDQKIIKDYSSADVSKKITKPLGQVYLIPNQSSTFTLFIVSENGNTYNLKLTPSKKVSGDSIVIKPRESNRKKASQKVTFNSNSYIRNINYLMQIMYLDKDEDGQYTVTPTNQAIETYAGLDSVLYKTYTNDSIIGHVILVKNTSKSTLHLTEAQFYAPHTLAIAIDNPDLDVNDFARVMLIQEAH